MKEEEYNPKLLDWYNWFCQCGRSGQIREDFYEYCINTKGFISCKECNNEVNVYIQLDFDGTYWRKK